MSRQFNNLKQKQIVIIINLNKKGTTTPNYLTINDEGAVELHGFDMISDFAYVQMYHDNKYMRLIACEKPETNYRFRVRVNADRTITDKRVIALVRENNLDNIRFMADQELEHYISTGITLY